MMKGLLILFSVLLPSHTIDINWNQTSWDGAVEFCSQSHRRLYILKDPESFTNITNAANISRDDIFWIGGKERRKFFRWNNDQTKLVDESVGCFQSEVSIADQFPENQPSLCMSYCHHHLRRPFSGLSGDKCICYYGLHAATQVVDDKCNVSCPGDNNYFCGGNNMTTVYRSAGSIKWKLYEPGNATSREDCVLVTQDQEQELIWYQDRCRHDHEYICLIFDKIICQFKGSSKIPCYFKSVEKTTWFEAVRKCSTMGGYLAGKDILQETSLRLDNQSFWTSLTRIRQRWINGEAISDLLQRSELLAPRRTGCMSLQMEGEHWTLQARPCNEKHPFICSKDLRPDEMKAITPSNLSEQKNSLAGELIIGVIASGAGVILAVFVLFCCVYKRNKKTIRVKPVEADHFYFILEKESVYNTISVNTQVQVSRDSEETYYDCLTFEGTERHSEQQRSISGQSDVDYHVYHRAADVTKDYDILRFQPIASPICAASDDYIKVSTFVKVDNQNNHIDNGIS